MIFYLDKTTILSQQIASTINTESIINENAKHSKSKSLHKS